MTDIWLPHTEHHRLPVLDHGPRGTTHAVVLHATEGPNIDGTIGYFTHGSGGVGAHVIVDNHKAVQLVPLEDKAWHAVDANAFAVGIEQVGYAEWSRAEWLKRQTLLDLVANRVAWICHQFDLGPPEHHRNVFGHSDGGAAWGGHNDPGPNYPWSQVIAHAQDAYRRHWGRG